jgi:transcriptional regulator with XRE-family HTH domain
MVLRIVDPKVFSKKLRELMKENNYTQEKLAEALGEGLARKTVGLWCIGRNSPNEYNCKKIAKLFDVDFNWLIGKSQYRNKFQEWNSTIDTTTLAKEVNFFEILEEKSGIQLSKLDENELEKFLSDLYDYANEQFLRIIKHPSKEGKGEKKHEQEGHQADCERDQEHH